MTPTTYQKPEIRDANDNIIQQGAFGKNTALANSTNDGWIDYVANDLEFLYDLAKDEVVPVPSLPASGQTNKTYLLTTTGVSYRWSGTEWVAVSSSEAVGRAESAALLAEQWATKTDGTVDGTEYSAKYYAEQAEASADDAQDTADDMADHLVQIDKNTGGVAKNSKRISNIEKLLQGNLYDYDTDDDSAYTKTVPSGALPYAGVEQIGGKTLVMNQKANSINATYWQGFSANVSVTYADGVAECTLQNDTASGYQYGFELKTTYEVYANHKYYYRYDIKANNTTTTFGSQILTTSRLVDGSVAAVDTWETKSRIYTPTADSSNRRYLIYPQSDLGSLTGLVYSIRNAMLIDLTLMFGSGNEPSTVQEFESMFPADYYPYNAGTLLSADVTEVESASRNLLDAQTLWAERSNLVVVNGDEWDVKVPNTLIVWENTSGYTGQITVSYLKKDTGSANSGYNMRIYYTDDTTTIIGSNSHRNEYTLVKATSEAGKIVQNVRGRYNVNQETYLKNVQIEYGATATPYIPYFKKSTPIPPAIQQLEGYGWSAGSVYNYVDFERKVYVQNVARVDMGTLNWTFNNDATYGQYFRTTMNAKKDGLAGLICPKYVVYGTGVVTITGSTGIAQSTMQAKVVYVVDPAYTDAPTFKSAMSGVYLYYELATPVETDISAYLTDNLIEVGAGGKLTFPNANGDDYHIPVPSDVTYMIDLQEAVANG